MAEWMGQRIELRKAAFYALSVTSLLGSLEQVIFPFVPQFPHMQNEDDDTALLCKTF